MPLHKIVALSRSPYAKEKIVKQLETQQCFQAYQMPTKVGKNCKRIPEKRKGSSDEDMTPMGTPVKVKDKVSSFLCLHNDKTKNLLLPNIGIPNVFRDNGDDDREWICHEQDRSPHHHLPSKSSSVTSM